MNSILFVPQKRPNAKFRLICFPYAGGSAAAYSSWISSLHPEVEVVLIQLPGRGVRIADTLYTRMDEVVKDIYTALVDILSKPFIFFGHSMGARIAYEVALMLYRHENVLPVHFIASGSSAPFVKSKKNPTYHLPDAEFLDRLRELNGTPEEVLNNHELMQLMLPVLRADFKIVETYLNPSKMKIPTQVSIFAGKKDDIETVDIEAWEEVFKLRFGSYWFDGGHFFIHENNVVVIRELNAIVAHHVSKMRFVEPAKSLLIDCL